MDYELRACLPEELPELGTLANQIFRSKRGGDMRTEYPLLFAPENCPQLRVAIHEGRIVAHVGICIRDAVILGARVRTASIGSVGTDPDHRGAGLASRLMHDAAEHSRNRGAALMLISGGRGLYRRLGYVPAGRFLGCTASRGQPEPGLHVRLLDGDEVLEQVIHLHQREPVRFIRPGDDWRRLLAAGMLMNQPSKMVLVERSGRPAAYLAVQTPGVLQDGTRPPPTVAEFAGSRSAAAGALGAVASLFDAPEARLVALADDLEFKAEAENWGFELEPVPFEGTLGIIDPAAFLSAVHDYTLERQACGSLEFSAAGEGARVRLGTEELRLETMGALTALVFGGDTEEAAAVPAAGGVLGESLARVFPMPLPWYGYNYV